MAAHANSRLDLLIKNSTPYKDPLARIDWGSLDKEEWWLPERAISLYGIAEYDALPETIRRQLSQYEFLNFVDKALWLEGLFMERISRALGNYSVDEISNSLYRLHELREEAGHSLMFLELIRQSGLLIDPEGFKRPQLCTWVGRHAPLQSSAFWITTLIGEQIPDRMNRIIRRHRSQISKTIYDIITLHTIDEARHIIHAKETLDYRVKSSRYTHLLMPFINYVFRQFIDAFFYPPKAIYRLAGLDNPSSWEVAARTNQTRLAFVKECISPTLKELHDRSIRVSLR